MESLDNVKRAILAYIQRKRRIKLDELKQWVIDNNIGLLTLYITLNDIIQERQRELILGPQEQLIKGNVEVMGKVLEFKLPSEITLQVKQKRSGKVTQRRRIRGQRTLLDVLEDQRKETEEAATGIAREETNVGSGASEGTAITPQEQGIERQEGEQIEVNQTTQAKPVETEETGITKETGETQGQGGGAEQGLVNPTQLTLDQLAQILSSELKISTGDAVKLLTSVGQYLNRYWSVGLIRLIEDAARGMDPDLVQRALKVLERLGFIELINPGVVNRKRDVKFPVPDAKISDLV